MPETEKSCGTILFTEQHGARRYVLVRNLASGNCAFPKGHAEEGETERETALRETWEETSVTPEIIPGFRRAITYTTDKDREKTVTYFLASCGAQTPVKNPAFEPLDLFVLPYRKAREAVTHESARGLLDEAERFLNLMERPQYSDVEKTDIK